FRSTHEQLEHGRGYALLPSRERWRHSRLRRATDRNRHFAAFSQPGLMETTKAPFWTRQRKWKWIRALGLVLLLYVMLRWFEHAQVYFPTKRMGAEVGALARPAEDVYFKARDGVRLNGWFFPANSNSPRAHPAMVLFIGNP